MNSTNAVISLLVLSAFSLTASAQNAGSKSPATPGTSSTESPQAAITRTQPTAPVPANAPRFASSGLELKIASFGVSQKERATKASVTISVVLINNNDYDVGLLNVGGFSVIDNAGNSFISLRAIGHSGHVDGVIDCSTKEWSWCLDKEKSWFIPYDRYTVVSAKTAIPITFFTENGTNGEVGDLFTFSTKLMMYKVGMENEIARTKKVETPRLITIGIPNILRHQVND